MTDFENDEGAVTAADIADAEEHQAWVRAQMESGQGQLQGDLGAAFRDSGIANFWEAQDALPVNVDRSTADILTTNGGSIGDVFRVARAGLSTSYEAARLGLDYQRLVADPYQVGTQNASVTAVPARVSGDNRPGSIAGAWGLPWGQAAAEGTDMTRTVLLVGAAILGGLAIKKAWA